MTPKAEFIANLFDNDIETSLNIEESVSSSFADRCKDIQATMDKAPVAEVKVEEKPVEKPKPAKSEEKPKPEPEIEPESEDVEDVDEDEEDDTDDVEEKEVVETKVDTANKDNPLDLYGTDFTAYQELSKKYPQFVLYSGSVIFKEFYRYKVKVLKTILTKFPVLKLQEYRAEVRDINVDHSLGEAGGDQDSIRRKLDDACRCRVRVGVLLSLAYEQSPLWERFVDLLRSKLFKDHDLKGAHKRESLVIEHMLDIEAYVGELKGFVTQAKYIDSLLAASSESLSRQLACIQSKQASIGRESDVSVIAHRPVHKTDNKSSKAEEIKKNLVDAKLDTLDTIDDGVVPVYEHSKSKKVDLGSFADDDELANIGV